MRRYLENQVKKDLIKKMVFVGGPRQVGKTTLSLALATPAKRDYLNWDADEDRTRILAKEFAPRELLIFDELHKYRKWRNYLKGIYDSMKAGTTPARHILVTGSARLDVYRFGGDSLQGRYHYLRLLPYTVDELGFTKGSIESLFRYSGFPEPFHSQDDVEVKRWAREYKARLVREDLRDLESVQDLQGVELLYGRLPQCVGSPLSLNSLREDLQVAHKTVANWCAILERLYAFFRVSPFGAPKIRAVKKEQKLYFFDWSVVQDEGARFENLIAVHLLKKIYWLQDSQGRDLELRYFRDTDKREVDFIVVEGQKPILAVECKLSDETPSRHLYYFHSKFPRVPAWQVSLKGKKSFQTPEGIRVANAMDFLKELDF